MKDVSGLRQLFGIALVYGSVASACGGRTEGGLDDGVPYDPVVLDSSTGGSSAQTATGHGGAKTTKTTGKGTVLSDPTALGPCEPGIEQWRASSCDFLANGLCYETKLAACACVCPRDSQNSTCFSSFDVPAHVNCL